MEQRATYNTAVQQIRRECLAAFAEWVPPCGDEIRAALSMANWSAEEFARRVGVNGRTVRRWVLGESDVAYSAWCVLAAQAGLGHVWMF